MLRLAALKIELEGVDGQGSTEHNHGGAIPQCTCNQWNSWVTINQLSPGLLTCEKTITITVMIINIGQAYRLYSLRLVGNCLSLYDFILFYIFA